MTIEVYFLAELHPDFTLSTTEAAELLGIGQRTLVRWRTLGYGPKHIKIGPRNCKYSRAVLLKCLDDYYMERRKEKWKLD